MDASHPRTPSQVTGLRASEAGSPRPSSNGRRVGQGVDTAAHEWSSSFHPPSIRQERAMRPIPRRTSEEGLGLDQGVIAQDHGQVQEFSSVRSGRRRGIGIRSGVWSLDGGEGAMRGGHQSLGFGFECERKIFPRTRLNDHHRRRAGGYRCFGVTGRVKGTLIGGRSGRSRFGRASAGMQGPWVVGSARLRYTGPRLRYTLPRLRYTHSATQVHAQGVLSTGEKGAKVCT